MGKFVKGDVDSHIILRKTGTLKPEKLQEVVAKIVKMIS